MSLGQNGTTFVTTFCRVVDGDTLRIKTTTGEEDLRLLSLDTEESRAGSGKPVTPLGGEAKAEAEKFWKGETSVRLEFPGTESLEDCKKKYRGNYGRLLVWAYRSDGTDFQEHMIRSGLSPYFVKYGYACFANNHHRYIAAEREAQANVLGIWDQIAGNGSEVNNYAALQTWWTLRAEVIDGYRRHMATNPQAPVLNTRLDYDKLVEAAKEGETVTIFTELRQIRRIGDTHLAISIGSRERPFDVFVPHAHETAGQAIENLLRHRYIAGDLDHPRRGYAYLKGMLKMFKDTPEIVIESVSQISDSPTDPT